jgi:FkbM family methyltransferase
MDLTLEDYERLSPRCEIEHEGAKMVFVTPSVMTRWRVENIYQKEPCTLEWIADFQPADILVDVGANVGMYTIWAAMTRRIKVFAFEPEAQNYALLNRNIMANGLHEQVKAYCVGLSDHQGLTQLHMADMRVGGSNHTVGEAVDYKLEPMKAVFTQGCLVTKLDELVATQAIPVPTHIKIDVDGIEAKVVAGAAVTLKNQAVQSLLIETNTNLAQHRNMVVALTDLGFTYDPQQVHRAMRKDGAFKGVAEHVFKR